ncbi:MAG TPA: flavin reductase family protein [Steroidobacteraceae bacterium]|nr:flavin reductase family protein [Steroidobacteraceae bacterium]
MNSPITLPDPRRFRNTIGLFATGVAVIVARAGEETLAMTANAVSSVSLDPMLVMFCPSKRSNLARHLASLSAFSINILRHDQQALSTYFAGGWKEPKPPPFRIVPSTHAPRLEGSLAAIECEPWKIMEVGDHCMVFGRVMQLHTGVQPHQPLLFQSGRYRNLREGDGAPAPDLSDVRDEPAHIFYE